MANCNPIRGLKADIVVVDEPTADPGPLPPTPLAVNPPTCAYCLADPRHTPVAFHVPHEQRCPLCGTAYTGPRRSREYALLRDAGLVAQEP